MRIRRSSFLAALVVCWALIAAAASDSAPTPSQNRYGSIIGRVFDQRGMAQADVPVLVSRDDGRFTRTVYTEAGGRFRLSHLLPGAYAVEVLLPSFLPFRRGPVRVEGGAEVLLQVNLLALADSLELRLPEDAGQAGEEWKWVLRTGTPARSILRFQPQPVARTAAMSDPHERALRGTLQVLAGNESRGFARDPGLRTSFQVEYPWSGVSTLGFAGSLGWEQSAPAASFRANWNRQMSDGADSSLSVTVRQLFLPAEYWRQVSIPEGPSQGRVQSFTLGYESERDLSDHFRLQYGTLLDALYLGETLRRWSPFGRLTYRHSDHAKFTVAYVGAAPKLLPTEKNLNPQNLERWLAIPQISSDKHLQPVMEGGQHVEATLELDGGVGWQLEAAAFYDALSEVALSLAALNRSPILAGALRDPFSNRYFLSGGNYSSPGLRAAVGARLGEGSELIVGYGYAGGLRSRLPELFVDSTDALRKLIRSEGGHSLSVKIISRVPLTRTQITTSYRWIPSRSMVAPDPYDRSLGAAEPYLQLAFLQPIPSPDIFHGQFQAVASVTNLLAQGYLAVHAPDGTVSYLFPVARSFRGGFSFSF